MANEKLEELISQIQYMGGLESRLAEHLIANDVAPVVRCKDCEYTCPGTSGIVCTMWGAGTEPDGWCYKAERKYNG
jgi:hypothetical protein